MTTSLSNEYVKIRSLIRNKITDQIIERLQFQSLVTIAFTGGRDFKDYALFSKAIHRLISTKCVHNVLVGDAAGLDAMVRKEFSDVDVNLFVFEADWNKHGLAAGPMRNKAMMLLKPSVLFAFPGGAGTANCIKQAKEQGVLVVKIEG